MLDVYSISDGFQLCCQASKISLMDYQKPIIKCSLVDLNLWHTFYFITEPAHLSFIHPHMCRKNICFLDLTVKSIRWHGGQVVCARARHHVASVCIYSILTFSVSHLVCFGNTWTSLERSLSAEFPPQAKLVITFRGCHHFTAIHHHLELFGYIELSDGDRHC